MKKIIVLFLVAIILTDCSIFRTTETVITNNSDHIAYLEICDFKENGSHKGNVYIELPPRMSTVYMLYDNGKVKLVKQNRNFMKVKSNTSYEILNSPKKSVKVFNKTGERIILTEYYNLFDKTEIPPHGTKNIDIFTPDDFSPHAATIEGLVLRISKQKNNLVIAF